MRIKDIYRKTILLCDAKMPKGPQPKVEIQNVVASVTLFQKLDLAQIQRTFPDVEYKPAQFPGLVFRWV